MKYLFFMVLLASCSPRNVESKHTNYDVRGSGIPLEVITIEGCQYLYGRWGDATVLSHKGNCNNSIHPEYTRR